jgi:hypothetical protein
MSALMTKYRSGFRVGEWVEIRRKEEIFKSLDERGRLDGLPFMPEMLAFCGKRFRIYKSAHKTCDTVFPGRGRRMSNAVHLETRCNGEAHGGCQATCLIFWKKAWIKPVIGNGEFPASSDQINEFEAFQADPSGGCTEQELLNATHIAGHISEDENPTYTCQTTELPYATTQLNGWDMGQYIDDYTSGNVRLDEMIRGFVYMCYSKLVNAGIGWGPSLRWLYDLCQRCWGGKPYPRRTGTIRLGDPTPSAKLDLMPGELVRIKSYRAILATIDQSNKNRGMIFDGEMVPYCGGSYRVLKRIDKIINEQTGKMQEIKTPCIILENVVCQARYSKCRLFCPRSIYSYWREIWLERNSENLLDTSAK